jgi:hypothetical protein
VHGGRFPLPDPFGFYILASESTGLRSRFFGFFGLASGAWVFGGDKRRFASFSRSFSSLDLRSLGMTAEVGFFPVRRNLPDAYYPVISEIIVQWAYLESLLRDCVYMLLRVSQRVGRVAVRSPRANEIVLMTEELMALRSFTARVNFKEYRKALVKVQALVTLWLMAFGLSVPRPTFQYCRSLAAAFKLNPENRP